MKSILESLVQGAFLGLISYGIWRFKKLMDDSEKAAKEKEKASQEAGSDSSIKK